MTAVNGDAPQHHRHNHDRDEVLRFWQCPNCGQTHFSDEPPDMCAFCGDFTTWRRIQPDAVLVVANGNEAHYVQLPLPLIYYDDDDEVFTD